MFSRIVGGRAVPVFTPQKTQVTNPGGLFTAPYWALPSIKVALCEPVVVSIRQRCVCIYTQLCPVDGTGAEFVQEMQLPRQVPLSPPFPAAVGMLRRPAPLECALSPARWAVAPLWGRKALGEEEDMVFAWSPDATKHCWSYTTASLPENCGGWLLDKLLKMQDAGPRRKAQGTQSAWVRTQKTPRSWTPECY